MTEGVLHPLKDSANTMRGPCSHHQDLGHSINFLVSVRRQIHTKCVRTTHLIFFRAVLRAGTGSYRSSSSSLTSFALVFFCARPPRFCAALKPEIFGKRPARTRFRGPWASAGAAFPSRLRCGNAEKAELCSTLLSIPKAFEVSGRRSSSMTALLSANVMSWQWATYHCAHACSLASRTPSTARHASPGYASQSSQTLECA